MYHPLLSSWFLPFINKYFNLTFTNDFHFKFTILLSYYLKNILILIIILLLHLILNFNPLFHLFLSLPFLVLLTIKINK